MKKTFQKTLIAAAAGVALMSVAGTASANSLLFPYFTTVAGASSIVSISSNTAASATKEVLHYVYNYGSTCEHYDGNGSMTANDLMQHSVASTAAGGFGLAVAADKSGPFYFPLRDYGFLVVSTKTTATAKISGEMIVSDTNTGLVSSVAAIDGGITDTTTATGNANEGDFRNIVDSNFNLSAYSTNLATTTWYAVVGGNMNPDIVGLRKWAGAAVFNNNGLVYDNDENPYSGLVTKTVTCAGAVDARNSTSGLMTAAQVATVGPNGWMMHATAGSYSGNATGVIMNKIQVVTASKVALMHREQAPAF